MWRLITNLDFIQVIVNGTGLRIDCRALALYKDEPNFVNSSPGSCLQGYGTSGSWRVFTRWLSCDYLDYELEPAEDRRIIVASDDNPDGRPLYSGATLKFGDGLELYLQAEDHEQPIEVSDHEEGGVLTALEERVRRYYRAPYFPVLNHVRLAISQHD